MVLLPIAAIIVVKVTFGCSPTFALGLSLFATSWLLVIGTIALRMMLKDVQRDHHFANYWLPKLHFLQLPSLSLIVICNFVTLLELVFVYPGLAASQYAAILFTILATLEYINYYHRQLQHFDNAADFKRLMAGRGFRKSHLAKSLKKWRTENEVYRSRPIGNSTQSSGHR